MKYVLNTYYWVTRKFRKLWDAVENKLGIPNKPYALPMRSFSPDTKEYTWEDFNTEAKAKYPIRYWIFEDFDSYFRVKLKTWIEDPLCYIDDRFFRKQHLLNLMHYEFDALFGKYKYGYLDPCSIVEAAIYKSFEKYINESKKYNQNTIDDRINKLKQEIENCTEDDRNFYISEIEFYTVIKEINDFYSTQRPQMLANEKELWNIVRDSDDKSETYKKLHETERVRALKTKEIMHKIVEISERLWV